MDSDQPIAFAAREPVHRLSQAMNAESIHRSVRSWMSHRRVIFAEFVAGSPAGRTLQAADDENPRLAIAGRKRRGDGLQSRRADC